MELVMPRPILRFALLLFATTVVSFSSLPCAFADEVAEAQELYQEGMDSYFAGDYSEAIVSFKKAYDLDPNPIFLFNMSIAYEKAGNFEEALETGKTAQASGRLPEQASQINQARLPALGTIVKTVAVAGRVSGTASCQSDSDCRSGRVCDATTNMCVARSDSGLPSADGGPFLGIPLSVIGWIGSGLAVFGIGLTATAIVVDLGLGNDIENYNALPDEEKRSSAGQTIAEDIESQQQTGQLLLYSGGTLMAVGAGLVVYDLFFKPTEEDATVGISVGKDSASVRATWTF